MLPRATADLPPVVGTARTAPADTRLEELLDRRPDGGPELWIRCRHRDLATGQVQHALARAARVPPEAFRHAGGRDRYSDCRRWFTVPADLVEEPGALRNAGCRSRLRVEEVRAGAAPIRPEDVVALAAVLRVHDGAGDVLPARAILDRLRRDGCPNYLGAAALGEGGRLAKWGRLLALGRRLPDRVRLAKGAVDRRRCLQALQARLFNACCAARLRAGTLGRCLPGDLVLVGLNRPPAAREVLPVDDPAAGQPRLDAGEAVVLGPLFGRGCEPATGEAGALEAAVLAEAGLAGWDGGGLAGGRRPLLFRPAEVQCTAVGADLELACRLPVDAAVTVLLEELLHPDRPLR